MAKRKQIVSEALAAAAPDHNCKVDYTRPGMGEVFVTELMLSKDGLSADVVQDHRVDFMYRRTSMPKMWVVRSKAKNSWGWENHKEFATLEEAAKELATRV